MYLELIGGNFGKSEKTLLKLIEEKEKEIKKTKTKLKMEEINLRKLKKIRETISSLQ